MSTLKVNTINAATSGQAVDVDISNPRSFRNLVINGAMQVAQRGTSSTTSGFGSVDRFQHLYAGTNEAPTFAQHALTSSDTGPWEKGFRNSLHATNGNQTGGADAADEIFFYYQIEAQDLANSGWDYTSSSSYITFSFWIKSSVAQNFYGNFTTRDGTSQNYAFETGSLTANTWTKIEKTIPGNSNITIDNNTGEGITIGIFAFYGTNYTTSGHTLNAWAAKTNSSIMPDNTSTWYTTNDATFEITGVQLEVGSVPTEFEHRSYADELRRCQRYYQEIHGGFGGGADDSTEIIYCVTYPVKMRATPSVGQTAAMTFEEPSDADRNQSSTGVSIRSSRCSDTGCVVSLDNYSSIQKDQLYFSNCNQNSGGKVTYSAEL